ncbi:MAG TPA: carboxypeptidase-like regulatory domain-containing protein [Vicinamibacterales bacterium]|nr:carboxypeptidase-like regulatory domain-containing protein [Vicinamibacterales bacterium]
MQRDKNASRMAVGMAVAAALMSGSVVGRSPTSSQASVAPASSVVGTVVDAPGRFLPGVVVTAIPQAGGEAHAAISGIDGTYKFENLAEGIYRIDWDLPGFDVMRRNLVPVRRGEPAQVDVTLPVSTICECLDKWARLGVSRPRLTAHIGQVVDESGRPLPHARLEIVGPVGREVAYANREGRFQVRLSPNQTWPLTARDSGFGAVTLKVSGSDTSSLVVRLPNVNTRALPALERIARPCCPGDLFTNLGP